MPAVKKEANALGLVRSSDADTPLGGDDDRYRCYTDLELGDLPPQRAVLDGLLFEETLTTIIGKWESFKSFIAIEMAFCISTKSRYHGRETSGGAVIYFAGEGRHGIAKRVKALRMSYNIGDEIPLVFSFACVDIGDPTEVAKALIAADRKLQTIGHGWREISAVFIDTLAAHMPGNENGSEEMKRYLEGCRYIRRQTGACVVSVHHAGWSDEIRSRGHTSLPAGVDTEILVERDGDHVTIRNSKQKDSGKAAEFRLESFPMADSLVFRSVVPGSPKLTPNELTLLREVPREPGIGFKSWHERSGLAKGSFDRGRNRLLALCYVKRAGEKYAVTDAGVLALGTKDHSGTSEVPR